MDAQASMNVSLNQLGTSTRWYSSILLEKTRKVLRRRKMAKLLPGLRDGQHTSKAGGRANKKKAGKLMSSRDSTNFIKVFHEHFCCWFLDDNRRDKKVQPECCCSAAARKIIKRERIVTASYHLWTAEQHTKRPKAVFSEVRTLRCPRPSYRWSSHYFPTSLRQRALTTKRGTLVASSSVCLGRTREHSTTR